jgi:hypothetical protein
MTACAGFTELGVATTTSGNSLDCRTYHASVASTTPANAIAHCPHVGIAGGYGVCGTAVDGFCDVAQTVCTGANQAFADLATCKTAAAAFPASGVEGDTAYDTLQCRVYHLGVASQSAALATAHCPHIMATSTQCTGTKPLSSSASSMMLSSSGSSMMLSSSATDMTTGTGAAAPTATISAAAIVVVALVAAAL